MKRRAVNDDHLHSVHKDPVTSEKLRADKIEETILQTAWAYYHDGLNQSEIAGKYAISRASVVNYLQEARRREYVRVTLNPNVFQRHQLSADLKDTFGLQSVSITPFSGKQTAEHVARVTADWLCELLQPGDLLGVAWGETVYQVAEAAPRHPIENLTVVQLVGSRPANTGFAAEICSSTLARRFDARCINLHVPMIVSKPGLAKQLRNEEIVKQQFDTIARCNKVVFACGTCEPESHIVQSGLLTAAELKTHVNKGAIGVICGRLIDEHGQPVVTPNEKRMLAVPLEQMKNKSVGLMVGSGPERVKPMLAAIRGGFVTHLSTCTDTAMRLLEQAE